MPPQGRSYQVRRTRSDADEQFPDVDDTSDSTTDDLDTCFIFVAGDVELSLVLPIVEGDQP